MKEFHMVVNSQIAIKDLFSARPWNNMCSALEMHMRGQDG